MKKLRDFLAENERVINFYACDLLFLMQFVEIISFFYSYSTFQYKAESS